MLILYYPYLKICKTVDLLFPDPDRVANGFVDDMCIRSAVRNCACDAQLVKFIHVIVILLIESSDRILVEPLAENRLIVAE